MPRTPELLGIRDLWLVWYGKAHFILFFLIAVILKMISTLLSTDMHIYLDDAPYSLVLEGTSKNT